MRETIFMKNSAKYKYMAVVAFMFLLPFLILSMHFARGYEELATREALARMDINTRTAASRAADLLALKYDISGLAGSSKFLRASGPVRKKMLESRIKENPNIFFEFSVLTASGKEKIRTGPASSAATKDHSGTGLFKKAVSERSPSGAVEYGKYTLPVLVMLSPLFPGGGNEIGGFLLSRMSLAHLGESVRAMGRSSHGNLGLMDGGGRVISDSRGYSIMAPGVKAPGEVLRTVNVASGKGLEDFHAGGVYMGRPYLVSVSRIDGTRWWIFETVDASSPVNHAYSFWVKRVILIGVMLILACSFASYRLALRWLHPRQ